MQNLSYFFRLVLLCNIIDITGMEPAEPPRSINPSDCISSLQSLCIRAIKENVTKGDLNKITSPEMMEQFSSFPPHLSMHIVGQVFYHKSHSQLDNAFCNRTFCSRMEFNEQNQEMIIDHHKCKKQLETYSLKGELVSSLPWPDHMSEASNGSLLGQIDVETGNTISIAKNGKILGSSIYPNEYPFLMRILRNEQEVLLNERGKYSLFNFVTSLMVYSKAEAIVFNKPETLCVIEKEKAITVIDKSNTGQNKKFEITNVDRWSLSPSGKSIFIARNGQPGELFSTIDMSVLFGNKLIPEKMFIPFIRSSHYRNDFPFDSTERYAISRQVCHHDKYTSCILDIQSQNVCLSFESPIGYEAFFYEKYFAIVGTHDQQDTRYLIHRDDLQNTVINKKCVYILDDLAQLPITKTFNDHSKRLLPFHPSGDFIATNDIHNTWRLIHIESGTIVAQAQNVHTHSFSQPKGDIIKFDYTLDKGIGIFSLRNDFTTSEYLLFRFMAEKNITPADLSQYPHMKVIYDTMDEDKRSFSPSQNGIMKS